MDLLVFLNEYVEPQPNAVSLMAKFAATYIGLELNGATLGIAHHDDFMGDVTVAGNMFETNKDSVMFMFNFRIPKGIDLIKVEATLNARLKEFSDKYGVHFSDQRYLDAPLYNDPQGPFVQRLLSIYNRVTGENRQAESTGGGTYAKRIPNAVVFGPKMPDTEYLGHQPNEHIKLSTLNRNIEVLTYTMSEFAF
jgi:acetylornithine deacetylase/succinyl-diaminopimelate desuccinylase-like protein